MSKSLQYRYLKRNMRGTDVIAAGTVHMCIVLISQPGTLPVFTYVAKSHWCMMSVSDLCAGMMIDRQKGRFCSIHTIWYYCVWSVCYFSPMLQQLIHCFWVEWLLTTTDENWHIYTTNSHLLWWPSCPCDDFPRTPELKKYSERFWKSSTYKPTFYRSTLMDRGAGASGTTNPWLINESEETKGLSFGEIKQQQQRIIEGQQTWLKKLAEIMQS